MATNRLHQDYTVAWLCALPCEMAAAEAMLDEKHSDLPTATGDDNTYILGRVYSHNVVIACCRSGVYGTTSASTCATQLQATFKSIRFFLLVGIGGGAPTDKADIRLGDVVVSRPTREFGGVVQYDYGKTMSGGRFVRTGLLNKPRSVLLTALARLEAAHKAAPSKIPATLAEMVERNPGMGRFTYKGKDRDILFDSEYDHCEENDTCDDCDTQRAVVRPDRMDCEPVVHYGLIASGNQVIKHAQTRDRLAQELGILCFEMEAAGVMDDFQCLVVRGICDYSDSHKNKQWQEYAAATAAAFAKELLSVVHAVQVLDTPLLKSDALYYRASPPSGKTYALDRLVPQDDASDFELMIHRISDYDEKRVHRRLLQKRLVGTTRWFLDNTDFKAWFSERTVSALWCSGKIGSGKTIIATTAVEAAVYRNPECFSPTVWFYCEAEHRGTLEDVYILSSFIKQLCEFLRLMGAPCPQDITTEIRKFFGAERIHPDLTDLEHIFRLLFELLPDTVYIIDGLDALDQKHSKSLLQFIQSLFRSIENPRGPRILLFSRDQVPGYINMATFIPGIRRISTSKNVMRDIKVYLDTSVTDKSLCRRLTDNVELLEKVRQTLLTKSLGMFLWVHLVLEILWDTCHTDAEIRSALATLPKGLEEVYSRCLDRITFRESYAPLVLKWVSFATRPLHIEELREAVSFGLEDTRWNEETKPQKDVLLGCCANLVIVDRADDCVRFAHSSVQQYLEKRLEQDGDSNSDLAYPTIERGNLECGELCVAYLSFSDFSLQVREYSTEGTAIPAPSPASIAQQVLSRHPRTRRLLSRLLPEKSGTPITFHAVRTQSTPDWGRYKFLNYAVTNWATHTKKITDTSLIWGKFMTLVTCFNETWNFQPWVAGGRSNESRIHGLFSWAVKEQHEPLLSIAMAAGESYHRICNLPLIGERLPALHLSSKLGYTAVARALRDSCKLNMPDWEGRTALHHAASRGHTEICHLLLDKEGMKVDTVGQAQCTPLWLAASNGHVDVARVLIQNTSNAEVKETTTRQSPLSVAARNGHLAMVDFLLQIGTDLESKDGFGRTPLLWAVLNGREEVTKLLLKRADLEVKDDRGWAPLSTAAAHGYGAIVSLLLDRGSDMEAWGTGQTPLSEAARNGQKAIVKLLLDRGAHIESRGVNGETPLAWAAASGYKEAAKLLLTWGAEIEAEDTTGKTPLLFAASQGHPTLIQLLAHNGANLEATDNTGRTPLSWAAGNGNDAEVALLLELGADAEHKDAANRTPLSWAEQQGKHTVVKALRRMAGGVIT